jgi:hypothetical protein
MVLRSQSVFGFRHVVIRLRIMKTDTIIQIRNEDYKAQWSENRHFEVFTKNVLTKFTLKIIIWNNSSPHSVHTETDTSIYLFMLRWGETMSLWNWPLTDPLSIPQMYINESRAGINKRLWEILIPVPSGPLNISHGLLWTQTRVSMVNKPVSNRLSCDTAKVFRWFLT